MEKLDKELIDSWTKKYISQTLNSVDSNKAVKCCSSTHYEILNVDKIIQQYIGDITGFINFLETEWDWIVTHDEETGKIIANENKEFCLCPLYKEGIVVNESLCLCSEGFATLMFSKVLQKDVQVNVVQSYIRDKKPCVYEIYLE